MGLLDVLNGMQHGPRGSSRPSSQSSGGMSPMTMAILALLAWKAAKHFTAPGAAPASPAQVPPPAPANSGGGLGGGFGDILKGPLGGLLGGAAAGSVISGGLGDLMKQLQQGGQSDAANSWVGKGPNKAIAPGDLGSALGADQIDSIASQSGLSRDDLPEPVPAASGRSSDAGRQAADRQRSARPAVRRLAHDPEKRGTGFPIRSCAK